MARVAAVACRYVLGNGTKGAVQGQFASPVGICQLPAVAGAPLVVADWGNCRLQVMSVKGRCLGEVALDAAPATIVADATGHGVWVACSSANEIRLHLPPRPPTDDAAAASSGLGDDAVRSIAYPHPWGLARAVTTTGTSSREAIVTTCIDLHCVKLLDVQSGEEIWTSTGTGFKFPYGATVVDDLVYVCDRDSGRLQVLSLRDGSFVSEIGSGRLSYPSGVAYDELTRVLFVAEDDKISVWTTQGELVHQWGTLGSKPGQFNNFHGSLHVASASRKLFAVDRNNHRVQVFELAPAAHV